MTNVFLSWGGDLSKQIAEELRTWIPSVLQFAKPYFTPNDIEKGSKWSSEITQKLADTHVGIICLTRDNLQRPWILFESGALSKDLEKSKVCSVLFDVDQADLSGPLSTFQTTTFDRTDFKKLLSTINDAGGDQKLNRDTFERVFDMWWPQLENSIRTILEKQGPGAPESVRSDRELLEEILSLSRVASRRLAPKQSSRPIPPGLVKHLLSITGSLVGEAGNYNDKEILHSTKELVEIADYLNSGWLNDEEISESISKTEHECERVANRIELAEKRNDDDEIPF